jgi:hypothetical protein
MDCRGACTVRRVNDVCIYAASDHFADSDGDLTRAKDGADHTHHSLHLHPLHNGRQAWQHQPNIRPGADQGLRQCAYDVGQTPSLDQWIDFRGNVQDFHAGIFLNMSAVTSVTPFSLR